MHTFTTILAIALPFLVTGLVVVWIGISIFLFVSGQRARTYQAIIDRSLEELRRIEASEALPEQQVRELARLAASMERMAVLRVATALPDRSPASEVFARCATTHHGLDWFVQQASASRSPRATWKRISALRLLAHQGYSGIVPLLGQAVGDPDGEIVGAALAILGRIPDMKAADILITTLKSAQYAPSRVATYLDQFPLPVPALLRPLLHSPESTVRYWGVTLLGRYPQTAGLENELAALTRDPVPLVRRAAIASLARINVRAAVDAARPLLVDPVWYVRAHAARALAEAEDPELAADVAPLLADREWWVRTAAKEALQRMGSEVWSALVPYLDHPDTFARNGAAEVLQNIGILDSLIVLEAATARPSATKIEILRKIAAAGGTRMTEALLDRVDQHTRPRVRELLASLGLEPAGVSV
jgi:HEAT repeat protein